MHRNRVKSAAKKRTAAKAEVKSYDVLTWDVDKQKWTPQVGVRRGPWSLMGLRKPLRQLRDLGYLANRSDSFVLVEERPTAKRPRSKR